MEPHLDFYSVTTALRKASIPVLVLRWGDEGAAEPPSVIGDRRTQLLVPRARSQQAIEIVERLPWRYSWVRQGAMRLLPMVSYWFDGGVELELYWGLPAAPLPPVALRRLTAALWNDATEEPNGVLRPDPSALFLHLAVVACAPGLGHERDWRLFMRHYDAVNDHSHAMELARVARVIPALERALAAAAARLDRPGPGATFHGVTSIAWRSGMLIQRYVRPRRFRRLLAGSPMLGDAPIRCRVGGVETIAETGVFVPTPDAERIAELALSAVRGTRQPIVVEVGAGSGAIAIAIAAARPESNVHSTELFGRGVRCARRNARRLRLHNAYFYHGSLVDPLPGQLRGGVHLVIANLPFYPKRGYAAIGSVPRGTIQGDGADGLDLVRKLARDARGFLCEGGGLILQMFAWQWESLAEELRELGYRPGTPLRIGPFAICPAEVITQRGEGDPAPGRL